MTHSYGILEDQCQYSKVYCLTETGKKKGVVEEENILLQLQSVIIFFLIHKLFFFPPAFFFVCVRPTKSLWFLVQKWILRNNDHKQ